MVTLSLILATYLNFSEANVDFITLRKTFISIFLMIFGRIKLDLNQYYNTSETVFCVIIIYLFLTVFYNILVFIITLLTFNTVTVFCLNQGHQECWLFREYSPETKTI